MIIITVQVDRLRITVISIMYVTQIEMPSSYSVAYSSDSERVAYKLTKSTLQQSGLLQLTVLHV